MERFRINETPQTKAFPCYTTRTGLKIGCAYMPPVRQLTRDEVMLQDALLADGRRVLSLKAVAAICLGIWILISWVTI
jgi:hypothetical protein